MNIRQAKEISIIDYLNHLKISPSKINGVNYWYISPFREEKTPSFKVNTNTNLFYDFGIGYGGTIIDFGIKYHDNTVSEFLKHLESNFFFWQQKSTNISFKKKIKTDDSKNIDSYETKNIENYKTKKIGNNQAITDYILSRRIEIEIAQKFLCEIYYQISEKHYFGVGFKNDSNGHEIRNKYFKGCIGKKDITYYKSGTKALNIFEGFFDFLSWMQLNNSCQNNTDIIVLNSLSLLRRIEPTLVGYESVHFYFDNDEAGINAGIRLLEINPEVIDHRTEYIPFKDFA